MGVLYGAVEQKSPTKETNYSYGTRGKNSEVFTENDVITAGVNGMFVAGAGDAVLGVIAKTQTMAGSNETVEKVEPAFTPIDQDYEFLMGTNADLDPLADVNAYFDITGTTGIQQVNVSAGHMLPPYGIVMCTKVDPNQVGGSGAGSGLRQGLFKFVKILNYRFNA